MMTPNSNKFVSWKWIMGLMILIISFLATSHISSIQSRISTLEERKLDKDEYIRTMGDINKKLDLLITIHTKN